MVALPLEDMVVIDFTHAAAGPFATMFLADLGATVIKVEKPGRGDGSRYMGEPLWGPRESDYFAGLNKSKKAIAIDLRHPDGLKLALHLIARANVVVENFRPRVMPGLGLGFNDAQEESPGLIYCSISAFGDTGPWKDQPANDIIVQSVSGLMALTGEEGGGPVRIGAPVADYSTGLFALSGILAAYAARDKHPKGQHIKVNMLDASLALSANYVPSVAGLGRQIHRYGRAHAQIVPYQAFECADGSYLMIGAFTNAFWRGVCDAVGHPEWKDDDRFRTNADRLANRNELVSKLEAIFRGRVRREWEETLNQNDVPNSPVLDLGQTIRLPQVENNESIIRLEANERHVYVVACPIRSEMWGQPPASFPPAIGQDTDQVLQDFLDISEGEIASLKRDEVIA